MASAANADTALDEAPAGHARTAIYQRMMANDRSPPPPPPLTRSAASGMKQSLSDQALYTQGRQMVNNSMRRSGSEGSLSTKGVLGIKPPAPRARTLRDAFAANAQGAGSRHDVYGLHAQAKHYHHYRSSHDQSPAVTSASRFYAHVVKTQSQAQTRTDAH